MMHKEYAINIRRLTDEAEDMEDLISRSGLYEKTVALEKEAMEHCLKLAKENGDPTDRMIWQAITAERTAFKHLICDEPPAQCWTPVIEDLPVNHGQVWCTYADGTVNHPTDKSGGL